MKKGPRWGALVASERVCVGWVSAANGGSKKCGAERRVTRRLNLLHCESVGFAKTLYPPYGQARNEKPGAVSRPGVVHEFKFHE
jgi:hypothetical protein